ncbi:MAG: hypothetical protein AAFZ15_11215 [Bacteroidota bacterium]
MVIGTGEAYFPDSTLGGYDIHKTRGSYGTGIYCTDEEGATWNQATSNRRGAVDCL